MAVRKAGMHRHAVYLSWQKIISKDCLKVSLIKHFHPNSDESPCQDGLVYQHQSHLAPAQGPASRATCFACIVCVIVSGLSKPVGPWLNKPVGPRLSKPAGPCGGQSLLGLPSKPEGYDASIRANLKS
eukprot:scaffold98170_cov16-Tisochrysis_lutea.AAC.1